MKKIIELNESQLVKFIKQIIEESIKIEPNYKIEATEKGNLKIINEKNKKFLYYKLKKGALNLFVDELTEEGITVSWNFITQTLPIEKEIIKKLIDDNWGKDSLTYTSSGGTTVEFVKIK